MKNVEEQWKVQSRKFSMFVGSKCAILKYQASLYGYAAKRPIVETRVLRHCYSKTNEGKDKGAPKRDSIFLYEHRVPFTIGRSSADKYIINS